MTPRRSHPALGGLVYFCVALSLCAYFVFAAVQGDYGLFRRAEIAMEATVLEQRLAALEAKVAELEALTRSLSDRHLDLDLLDERARDVLGLVRGDEIVVPR